VPSLLSPFALRCDCAATTDASISVQIVSKRLLGAAVIL